MFWNGQKAGGLSLGVKRDEWVKGFGGGWGGCECDGLVSNTLSLSMSITSAHPSMVSHSPVCFKAIALPNIPLALVGFIQMVMCFKQKALDKGMGSCHDISTFNKGKTFYQGEKGEKSNCFQ